MSDDDFAFEPMPGIPAPLPRGEVVLWQGKPSAWRLAVEAFALPWVAFYFGLVVLWRAAAGVEAGGLRGALAYGLPYAGLGLIAAAVLLWLAWAQARGAIYTITSARVLLRVGAALTVTFNIPFRQIAAARLDLRRGGHGTIALETAGDTRLAFLALWPHARPWHLRRPQPALRCIPDAARVARLLAEAAETRIAQPVIAPVAATAPATAPAAAPAVAPAVAAE